MVFEIYPIVTISVNWVVQNSAMVLISDHLTKKTAFKRITFESSFFSARRPLGPREAHLVVGDLE